ncbi:MAG TPA: class I SAM-dependent methyltransferase, partial [Labilithrix sp.]|nr:class I SAM-dependent methyltransferase [Labilithrix sp.]
GRNSIALATAGWKVTGVDISDVGVRIARDEALKHHRVLDAIDADLTTWDMGRDRWDLVAMIYAGSEPATIERAKASLRKGGVFVFEERDEDEAAALRRREAVSRAEFD